MRVRGAAVAGHLHPKLAPVQDSSVHGVHSIFGVALVMEADKGKAAALLGVTITGDVDVAHPAILLEDPAQGLGGGAVREIVDLQGSHAFYVRRRSAVAHLRSREPIIAGTGPGSW